MLIDWLSFSLPYHAAKVFSQQFEKAWDSDLIIPKRINSHTVEGSYSSSVRVVCAGGRMEFSGNPVKFFTGQNVVGSADLQELVLLTYEAMLITCNIPDCKIARQALMDGDVNLTRVDVTDHWEVGTDDDVRVFLKAVGERASIHKRGRGHFNSDFCSVGWGFGNDFTNGEKVNGSRRSTLKFYNKFEELKKHHMTCPLTIRNLLTKWVEGKVRVEACFRGMELRRLGYKTAKEWDEEAPRALLNTFLERLVMPDQIVLLEENVADMPRAYRMTYETWKQGLDVKSMMAKNTFYTHRRKLLEFGVDIGVSPVDRKQAGRVIHLIKVLEAKPVECPEQSLFVDLALDGFERLQEAQRRAAA